MEYTINDLGMMRQAVNCGWLDAEGRKLVTDNLLGFLRDNLKNKSLLPIEVCRIVDTLMTCEQTDLKALQVLITSEAVRKIPEPEKADERLPLSDVKAGLLEFLESEPGPAGNGSERILPRPTLGAATDSGPETRSVAG